MKTLRTFALLVSTAALLGLGGCASFTPKDMLAQFEPGEQPLYAVVAGKPRKMSDLSDYADFQKNCGRQNLGEIVAPSFNEWLEKNVCGDMQKWQFVPLVYHTKVWGTNGIKYTRAYAPVDWKIEEDDILELSMNTSKAKDATKESGCWWDGGKGATTAFKGGGAVCDGWNWRDQKFAKE
jgi:hypothetical protein